jgi:pimeloyl-ACP methyl ester carboxylesterase
MRIDRVAMMSCAVLWLMTLAFPPTAAAQSHYSGSIGPGSLYEIDVPATWNGDLVIYAHGIVQADQPVLPPTLQEGYAQLRAGLLAANYAVAASSFSSNGWSLDDAVRRTHQLKGIFTATAGRPRRVYLAGHSMGALAIVKLAERFPGQYDGALPMCGPLGGALAELQYAGDARVTFDYYFPGLLPGTAFDVPPGTAFLAPGEPGGPSPLFLQVAAALAGSPDRTLQWASAAKLPFLDAAELGYSSLYVIGFVLRYTNDFVERVNGKMPYDNEETQYQVTVSPDPAVNAYLSVLLNEGVTRYEADRAALNYYARNYAPTGAIGIPVLTLHTTRDAAIPFAHEQLFAAAVASAGQSHLLAQRAVDRWGHCAFTPGETQDAFAALVAWVEAGVKP